MDSAESTEHFSLRWNNYHNNLSTGFHSLLQAEDLVDVTLAAEGNFIQAHKIVLSICSPYFKNLFKVNPCQHPIVILKDVSLKELNGILEFMYKGEVSVNQEDLSLFLKTAEMLQIKGLTGDDNSENKNHSVPQQSPLKRTKLANKPNKNIPSQKKSKLDLGDSGKISESILRNQNNETSSKRIEECIANSPNENINSDCELTSRLQQPPLASTKIEPIDFDDEPTSDPLDDDSHLDSFDEAKINSYSKSGLNIDESSVSQHYSLAKSASNIFLLSEQPSESTSNSLPEVPVVPSGGSPILRPCTFCGKLLRKSSIRKHIQDIHSPPQSVHCTYCTKRFRTNNSLQNHMSIYHREQRQATRQNSGSTQQPNTSKIHEFDKLLSNI